MPRFRVPSLSSRSLFWGCALSTAILWWLAGAFSLAPLGWMALVPFFYFLFDPKLERRFRFGYLTGFVSFALINWWLIPTISLGAPAIRAPVVVGFFLSLVAVGLIAAIHALQVAFVAWQSVRKPLWTPLWCALLWTGLDALRTVSPLAHSWGALAFSQTTDLPILQSASLIGQHGLTFVCAFVAASLAMGLRSRGAIHFVAPAVLLLLLHGYGALILRGHSASIWSGKRVLVVQTDVSSLVKSNNARGETPFAQALRLTSEATETSHFDLVVWPETTAEFGSLAPAPGQKRRLAGLDVAQLEQLGLRNTTFLIGAKETFAGSGREAFLNDAALLSPDGKAMGRAKERLVPFGERAPFVEWLPFLAVFSPPAECIPGRGEGPLAWGNGKIAPVICFESCFPDPAKRLVKEGGQLLVVITNDEWFRHTEAPRQHAAMGVLRAVENGVPLVQSANGGESLVCDAQGRVLAHIPFGQAKAVAVTMP
jgi:apolipoprotein N-acyltransferase